MPLMIEMRDNLACPVVVCDHCGHTIDDARDGNMMWLWCGKPGREGDRTSVSYTHKRCCRAFEAANPGRWLADELSRSVLYLTRNLAMDREVWAEAERTADLLATL